MKNERTARSVEGHSFPGHLLDNSVWRSRLIGRTITEVVLVDNSDVGCILILDDGTFFSFGFSSEE